MLIYCSIHGLVSMGYSTFNVHLRLDVACTFACVLARVRVLSFMVMCHCVHPGNFMCIITNIHVYLYTFMYNIHVYLVL